MSALVIGALLIQQGPK